MKPPKPHFPPSNEEFKAKRPSPSLWPQPALSKPTAASPGGAGGQGDLVPDLPRPVCLSPSAMPSSALAVPGTGTRRWREEDKTGKAGRGVLGSTRQLCNQHLLPSSWMLRGTKIAEFLRENLSMTWIKGCILNHRGIPEATGHPAQASNPTPGTEHTAAHKPPPAQMGCTARCHAAATPNPLRTETPGVTGLQ